MPGYKYLFVVLVGISLLSACQPGEDKTSEFVESGQGYLASGDLEAAKIEFNNAVKLDQGNVEALYGLALIVEREKKWPQLEQFLKKIIEIDPQFIDARIRLANLYLGSNQIEGALEQSNALAKIAPDNISGKVIKAAVLYRIGNEAQARTEMMKILEEEPHNIDAAVLLANDFITAGQYQQAVELLDRAIAQAPDHMILNITKVRALNGMQDIEGSVKALNHLISLYPDSPQLVELLARQHMIAGNSEKALEVLDRFAQHSKTPDAIISIIEIVNSTHGIAEARSRLQEYTKTYPELPELQFALGDLHIASGNIAKAEQVIGQLMVSQDNAVSVRAKSRLARIYLVQGKYDEAEGLVSQILQTEPRNVSAIVTRTELWVNKGNVGQAVRALRSATRFAPESTEIMVALAKAHERDGEHGLANDYFVRAVNQHQRGSVEVAAYAGYLVRQERWRQADLLLSPMIESGAAGEDILRLAAQVKLNMGKWDEAQLMADRLDALGGGKATAAHIRGLAYSGKNEFDEAIKSLTEFQQSAPHTLRPMATLVDTYVRAGKRVEAEKFLDSVLEMDPKNFYAFLIKGSLHAYYQEMELAEAAFTTVVNQYPDRIDGYLRLTQVLGQQKKYERAAQVVEQGLKIFPDNLSLNISRASIQKLAGNVEQSIATYEALLQRNENLDVAANNLAMLLVEQGTERGLTRAAKVAERFRQSKIPHFKDTLGWVLVLREQYADAIPLLKEAAEALPNNGEVQYHLGVAYHRSNKPELARPVLTNALSLARSTSSWRPEVEELLTQL